MILPRLLGLAVYSAAYCNAVLSTVTLDYGTFKGHANTTSGIISFRGIRYADPPLGSLRWQPPAFPPSKKLGNVDATKFRFACIGTSQKASGATTSEDCLFGNVYIPIQTTLTSELPVLVFFHGGGFESGRTSKYPPDYLMQASTKPFIFATFEYRLGQFGFLGGPAVRNNGALNAGLLDQKAALQWVQRYIGKFGGDPKRVTIWGQSAGAGSVIYHLTSDGSVGNDSDLFHQAMGDSPSLLSLLDYDNVLVKNLFITFAGFAGCGSKSTDSATMSCLRAASTNKLATAGSKTLQKMTSSLYPLGPITDGIYIQKRPVDALLSDSFVQVPMLFGSNTNEGADWSATLANPEANTSFPHANEGTVFNFLAGQYTTFSNASFQTAVSNYYLLSDYGGNVSLQGQQMYGEMRYICTALLATGAAVDAGLPAYQYHWDNPTLGSGHGDELVAFFNSTQGLDAADVSLVTAMRQYWTSFVTSGIPVAAGAPAWTAGNDTDGSPRLLLHPGNVKLENVSNALSQRCAFWRGLAPELMT
ncbi:Alpha/Beta hydrolase protein [Mycena pura]|uniref:Carboxylic ester hydrolase n=1 Tax=Mycena pura TaxID=153505 RepID=A0AAD6VX61_9AGAR|nr:Alpha/Beta hydrolase protein [Mycena pura]